MRLMWLNVGELCSCGKPRQRRSNNAIDSAKLQGYSTSLRSDRRSRSFVVQQHIASCKPLVFPFLFLFLFGSRLRGSKVEAAPGRNYQQQRWKGVSVVTARYSKYSTVEAGFVSIAVQSLFCFLNVHWHF